MTTSRHLGIAIVLLAALAGPARADEAKTRAAQHFAAAEAAEKRSDWQRAIDEYLKAYAAKPHPAVLYNVAVDLERLEDWERAAEYYQRYLDESSDAPDRGKVEKKIAALREKAAPSQPADPKTPDPAPPPAEPAAETTAEAAPPAVPAPRPHLLLGTAYGIDFKDKSSRLVFSLAMLTANDVLQIGAVGGWLGKNDIGGGVEARLFFNFDEREHGRYYLRAAGTLSQAGSVPGQEDGGLLYSGEVGGGVIGTPGSGLLANESIFLEIDYRYNKGGITTATSSDDMTVEVTALLQVGLLVKL